MNAATAKVKENLEYDQLYTNLVRPMILHIRSIIFQFFLIQIARKLININSIHLFEIKLTR